MPYYETSQEWLRQSALLLEARPTTTRITTTYHLTDKTGTSKKRQKRRQQERQQQQQQSSTTATPSNSTTSTPSAPRASLTIKTFDAHSGACLKYRTTKAAEVSRLILSLGQLGRRMAALPTETDTVMADAEEVGTPGVVEKAEGGIGNAGASASAKGQGQTPQTQTQGQQGGGGGKGKKKRGKK
ncbi:hypothetical protein HD806DRAFT_476845 [Xylariaceae sp. AK1471]|nr:hypothetical protein HD806DRAFT_476845 [Xylariaceae sp. AK1471]